MKDGKITFKGSLKYLREKAEILSKNKKYTLLTSTNAMSPEKIQELVYELQVHKIELEMQNDELLAAYEKIKTSEQRYFDLYNMAPVGYCTLSKEGLILEANFTSADLFGLNPQAIIKKPITDFIFIEDQDIYYLCRKKFFNENHELSCELRMLKSDGTQFYAHLSADAKQNNNEISYIRLIINDITKTKQARDEIEKLNNDLKSKISEQLEELRKKDVILLQQSTLAQMGEMIAMIAHQWRQPLNAISGSAIELSLLNLRGNITPQNISKNTHFIQEITQKMSRTIDDFMNFNKEAQHSLFSLLNAIQITYEILEAQFINKFITVNINVDKELKIFHNIRALEHSLLNLLINSRDAFEEHPEIQNREINIYAKEDGDTIFLSAQDNAGGIAQDIIGKIFNPYFTTKKQGKGTGLGLYMTKLIIEEVKGSTISVESQDEKTTFMMKFPKA